MLIPRRDLNFLLYDWLAVDAATSGVARNGHDRETFDAVLSLAQTIAADKFEPINPTLDAEEPVVGPDGSIVHPDGLADALDAYVASGMSAATFPEDLGGSGLPFTVFSAAFALVQSASVAASAYPLLTSAAANLLVAHGSKEQIDIYARPMIEGRWFGTMCLSEPGAGSSLGDITTRAVPQDDGSYRLFGAKMWISGGDQSLSTNIVHLVLARVAGAAPGTKGLSLFIVPKWLVDDDGDLAGRNDVALVGLNHKMGYRGTTNTLLNFGEGAQLPGGKPGAIGFRVGAEGEGLAAMFHMMNEARISVGLGAVALGYAGYRQALDYARTRTQGRSLAARDPESPMVRLVDHPDVRRMLLAQKAYVEGGLALSLFAARLVDESNSSTLPEVRQRASRLLGVLTPIAKSWPSQWCLAANDMAIQVHGGYGYTRDYLVEQLYRDNRLNPIHEGTHGIQGLDLLGRKVRQNNGADLQLLASTIRDTTTAARAHGGDLADSAEVLDGYLSRLVDVTDILWSAGADVALAHASMYLEVAGHIVVAWIWLDQALAVRGDDEFARGKRAASAYFHRFELPKVGGQLDLLASLDRTFLDLDELALG